MVDRVILITCGTRQVSRWSEQRRPPPAAGFLSAAYLEAQLQGDFEQREVGQALHERGDFEGILSQFEVVGGRVDVLLDGLQHYLELTGVTWWRHKRAAVLGNAAFFSVRKAAASSCREEGVPLAAVSMVEASSHCWLSMWLSVNQRG